MNHVHWWLFGLSFASGLVLTLALIVRPVKRQVPVGASADKSAKSEPPTTKIPVENEPPTTEIPVEPEFPTTEIPVEHEFPTTKIPVEHEFPTTKIPVEHEFPTTKIPVAKESPTSKIPAAKKLPTTKIPAGKKLPPKKAPTAKESPTRKIPKLPFAPYGPGSARATPDGGGPAGWLVKGRSDTRLYYTPDDPTYDPTIAQVWFKDEESAMRAHFTPWRKSSRK
jgi:hypothetical protein